MIKSFMKQITAALAVVGICYGQTSFAQSSLIPDPFAKLSAPSPTTAALAKFTDIPSSGSTGSPEISIPLYEVNTSFVKLPISLAYQGGGITVDQDASNVGLGWSLNAGGILSRNVLGSVDNGTYQTYRMSRQTSFTMNNVTDYQQAARLLSGEIDGVPDLYIYNLPGYSGKFIIADQVRQLPMTNLQILKVNENEFNITTPDGNKYIFSAPEVSRNSSETSNTYNTVGWYLTKILSADKTDSVVLSYANTNYVSGSGRSFTRSFYQGVGGAWDGSEYAESIFSNSINGKQLTKIEFNQGSVEFNISWNTREDLIFTSGQVPLVTSMLVKNKAGVALRTVSFRYGYFTNGGAGTDNKRLKLSGIYINGGSSTDTLKAQRYNLIYNPGALPVKGTLAQDHWGYYNGADGNSTLLPSYSNCIDAPTPPDCYSCAGQPGTLSFVGANRNPNGTYASLGMLERMTLPTGGYAQYEWEPHDAINYESTTTYQNTAIGSATSSPTSTTFRTDSSADYYINPSNTPAGICGTLTGRMTIPSGSIDDEALITHASGQVAVYRRAGRLLVANINFDYSSSNQYNLSTNFSLESGQSYFVVTRVRNAGFSVVGNMRANIPTTVTPANKTVGGCRIKKIILQDPIAGKYIVKTYDYRIPEDTVHSSGRMRREPLYISNVIRFESIGKECQYTERYGVKLSSNSLISLGSGSHVNYTYIKETTGQAAVNGYTICNYENSNSQSEFTPTWRSGYLRTKTVYNKNNQPVSKERYVYSPDSRGDTSFIGSTVTYYVKHSCANDTVLNQQYPSYGGGKDWIFPSEWFHMDSTITDVYDLDVNSRVLTTSKAITYDNVKHLQASKTIEKNSEGLDLISNFRYPQDYTLPTGTLSQEAQAIKDMQTINIHAPLEVYSHKKLASGALQTTDATYMAYKSIATARGPVVLFDKQYEAEVVYPSGTFTPSIVSGTGISKNASYSIKGTAVLYDQSYNITEAERRTGDVDAYIWDYNRSYVVAQFKNARQADVAFSSFETDGKGNWTYAGTNVADASALTGKSSYSLALGAVSKTDLTSSNTYIVSYWTKNSSAYSITGTLSGYPLKGATINGWTYFEHKLSGITSVSISGTGQIDELRLYPATASAVTYTYDPLVGATSICNEGNKVTYYAYDSDGRLLLVKDQNGKILKQMDYQYQVSVTK